MIGRANECHVLLEGVRCTSPLDTGSTVSTVSHRFFQEYLSTLRLYPLDNILKVECAGGQMLGYLGYCEANICVPDLGMTEGTPVLLLVVPDTTYNGQVPVLLGTNILKRLMDSCRQAKGQRFLQNVAVSTPWWLIFGCLSLQDRALAKSNGKLGSVTSAHRDTIRIPINKTSTITGSCLMKFHT